MMFLIRRFKTGKTKLGGRGGDPEEKGHMRPFGVLIIFLTSPVQQNFLQWQKYSKYLHCPIWQLLATWGYWINEMWLLWLSKGTLNWNENLSSYLWATATIMDSIVPHISGWRFYLCEIQKPAHLRIVHLWCFYFNLIFFFVLFHNNSCSKIPQWLCVNVLWNQGSWGQTSLDPNQETRQCTQQRLNSPQPQFLLHFWEKLHISPTLSPFFFFFYRKRKFSKCWFCYFAWSSPKGMN